MGRLIDVFDVEIKRRYEISYNGREMVADSKADLVYRYRSSESIDFGVYLYFVD